MDVVEVAPSDKSKASVKSVFKYADFSKLWIGQFVSNLGSSLTFIVLPLYIYYYTGSAFWLGIIAVMQLIPVVFFSPLAGMFVDTHNRKPIMISSDILNAIFILTVPVIISLDKIYSKNYILIAVAVLVFLGATANRFFMPAREASIAHIVHGDELNIAVSISQTTMQLILVLGPIIGATIATVFSFSLAFIIDGASFLFSAFTILLIKSDLRPQFQSNGTRQQRPSLLLGTKKILQIKTLRFIIIIFTFLMFANSSINSFIVAFEETDLHMSQVQFGTSVSILGGSAVLAGVLLASKITKINRPLAFISGAFFIGGIILSPILVINQYWQLYLIFFLIGPVNIFVNIPANVIFFRDTTDEIRGQVFSALDMLISLFTIAGIVYGVIMASIIGLRLMYFLNALIFIIVGFLGLFYLFFINNLDNKSQLIQESSDTSAITAD